MEEAKDKDKNLQCDPQILQKFNLFKPIWQKISNSKLPQNCLKMKDFRIFAKKLIKIDFFSKSNSWSKLDF